MESTFKNLIVLDPCRRIKAYFFVQTAKSSYGLSHRNIVCGSLLGGRESVNELRKQIDKDRKSLLEGHGIGSIVLASLWAYAYDVGHKNASWVIDSQEWSLEKRLLLELGSMNGFRFTPGEVSSRPVFSQVCGRAGPDYYPPSFQVSANSKSMDAIYDVMKRFLDIVYGAEWKARKEEIAVLEKSIVGDFLK